MNLRIIVGSVLAGCLVLGAVNSATGQVWLEAPLLDVSPDDDRYGGYEPVEFTDAKLGSAMDGPLLVAQTNSASSTNDWVQPPGQIVSQPAPAPIAPRPAPVITPVPQPVPSVVPQQTACVSPEPMWSPPLAQEYVYSYGVPMAPQPRRPCPPWRPCGPDESFGGNWLIPQRFFGADYRPACAQHDACLASGCYSRKACDRMFLANMDCACNNSMFPILCRLEARKCYLGVRLFGWMY